MSTTLRARWLAINFAATIFVSAFLLFQIEPLVSKYILPWFGGTPAVWTTCLLFFQTLLFGGYAYAHISQVWLRPKQQAVVHLALIVVALAFLRVVPSDAWKPSDSLQPVGRILLLLTASVGLPYFVLSSTGPLIQAWFARAFPGRIPYRLYALSNVGSLLALLSYPFFFERIWDVPHQATFWSWGFYLYAALCGCSAVVVGLAFWAAGRASSDPEVTELHTANPAFSDLPNQKTPSDKQQTAIAQRAASLQTAKESEELTAPTLLRRILWLVLPAFASVTLLAITNHVCTDVAVMPFLWVAPLSLYLVTFIIAFDHPRWYRPVLTSIFTMLAIYTVAMVFSSGQSRIYVVDSKLPGKIVEQGINLINAVSKFFKVREEDLIDPQKPPIGFMTYAGMNFAALLGICMLCHGELFRLRPHPRYLTGYYLMIAAGGALGGVAVTLIAPQVFVTFFEWNLSLFLGFVLAAWLILRAILSIGSAKESSRPAINSAAMWWTGPILVLPVLVLTGFGIYDICGYFQRSGQDVLLRERNFFGTLRVEDGDPDNKDEHVHLLYHGRITHGLQYVSEERRHIPTTYYAPQTGVGRAIGFYRESKYLHGIRIGAVGLGTGTLAAYADQGDSIRFYEINPAVIAITEPGQWFTYLKDCRERGGHYEIELGDARLTLERELQNHQPQHFHVLVLDAFSGDAIPVHLLTEEAMQSYVDQLAKAADGDEEGAIAIHITNRYVDLEPVILGLAEQFGLDHVLVNNEAGADGAYTSDWMILTRSPELLKALAPYEAPSPENRDPPEAKKKPVLWTDGLSNLFDVLK
jgi:hypothetical protein